MYSNVNLTFIIGLPGSGKTTLGKAIVAKDPDNSILLDDLSLDFKAGFESYKGQKNVIITDPWLCNVDPDRMYSRVVLGLKLILPKYSFIYFANDPEACILNATRDPKPGGTVNFIKSMTKKYVIPEGAKVHPVYKEHDNVSS